MGKTVSAYVNDALAEEFQRVVTVDGRPPANVAARAIDLYALLPASARKGLSYIRAHAKQEELENLLLEFTRAVGHTQMVVATREIHDNLEPEVLAELGRVVERIESSTQRILPPPPEGIRVPAAPKASTVPKAAAARSL